MIGSNKVLRIIHAGALQQVMEKCLEHFSKQNLGLKFEMKGVGSREGAKRILSGEKYDIIALADQALFAELLVPDLVENYFIFAADQLLAMIALQGEARRLLKKIGSICYLSHKLDLPVQIIILHPVAIEP
ncbi:substrate-binding domain-containing protein [Desulfosporosinus fructosivorans]